jgi:hypothetical protein
VVDTNRWSNRLHTPDRDAQKAAVLTTESMSRLLEESFALDAEQWPALRAVNAG